MDIQATYRQMPEYLAIPLAVMASAVVASALGVLGAFAVDFLFTKLSGFDGPGAGVLLIVVVLNIAVSAFIATISILVNLHHRSSWRVPTLTFGSCIVLIRLLGPFDIRFAPFVLGTGAVTCLVSCWFLRGKRIAQTGSA